MQIKEREPSEAKKVEAKNQNPKKSQEPKKGQKE